MNNNFIAENKVQQKTNVVKSLRDNYISDMLREGHTTNIVFAQGLEKSKVNKEECFYSPSAEKANVNSFETPKKDLTDSENILERAHQLKQGVLPSQPEQVSVNHSPFATLKVRAKIRNYSPFPPSAKARCNDNQEVQQCKMTESPLSIKSIREQRICLQPHRKVVLSQQNLRTQRTDSPRNIIRRPLTISPHKSRTRLLATEAKHNMIGKEVTSKNNISTSESICKKKMGSKDQSIEGSFRTREFPESQSIFSSVTKSSITKRKNSIPKNEEHTTGEILLPARTSLTNESNNVEDDCTSRRSSVDSHNAYINDTKRATKILRDNKVYRGPHRSVSAFRQMKQFKDFFFVKMPATDYKDNILYKEKLERFDEDPTVGRGVPKDSVGEKE